MAPKFSHLLIFFISILLILLSPLPTTKSQDLNDDTKSPFQFLKNLQGSKKGDTIADIDSLKNYLKRLGYLNYDDLEKRTESNNNNYFDDLLEDAIKTYQFNYHLNRTGSLDQRTISTMMTPRCGVQDTVKGSNCTRYHNHSSRFLIPKARYSVFEKWPVYKTELTYGFMPGMIPAYKAVIGNAFNRWADVTKYFTFVETPDYSNSDITIGSYYGDHGDGLPFDGPGGTLAHAFSPPSGQFHLDKSESWSIGYLQPNVADLYSVALHEIGHLLGLAHSTDINAIMYPLIPFGVVKEIGSDDIQGIEALYNL